MQHSTQFIRRVLLAILVGGLVSCSNISVEQYADRQPKLNLKHYFNGALSAHGIVKSRGGKVTRYFNADIEASWNEDGVGTLNEQFVFDDGELQTRVWTLVPLGDGIFQATAGDVDGTALGQASGNSFFMRYVLEVPYNGRIINVTVDDRMYLVNENVLINESKLSKFGFNVGSVLLTIVKH